MAKKTLTTEQFIEKAKKVHGDRYDYSKTVYTYANNKVIIICHKHGEFEQIANNHLNACHCPKCSTESKSIAARRTTEQFIEKAKKVHGDRYDYSKVNYVTSETRVTIICRKHGEFVTTPAIHLQNCNCPKCAEELVANFNKLTTEQFIEKAKKVHGDRYDYSKTIYTYGNEKVIIICRKHGEFRQRANGHLHGDKCMLCGTESRMELTTSSTQEFIEKAKKVHGDKYDYHKTNYINARSPLWIYCNETDDDGLVHGDFLQTAQAHLQGRGCQKCAKTISKPEIEIQSLLENFEIQTNTRNIINHELDIYIPSKKLAIEYNGLYWHNEVNKPDSKYHLKKTEACEKQGIQLIHIFEDEWLEKPEIVKSRINNLLGINKFRVYARNCYIKEVDIIDSRKFLETNHIQGFVGSKVSYGLYFKIPNTENNVLVSLMTFGSLRKNLGSTSSDDTEYELLRFCNKLNTSVVGGASKLFKHFLKQHKPSKVISYADRRWSLGKLYEQLGFEFSHNSIPNYFYVIGQQRKNRFNFRKDILISKYGCSPEDTEHNFCFNQKWYRIYDCGTKVYVWKLNQ